eukprot:jgi/Ulvmu1/3660/UM017_0074.1
MREVGKAARCNALQLQARDPDLETTAEALKALDEAGAGIIELGVPYSDRLADGPTIQGAADRALRKGTTLQARCPPPPPPPPAAVKHNRSPQDCTIVALIRSAVADLLVAVMSA